jgi:hypothetical protein
LSFEGNECKALPPALRVAAARDGGGVDDEVVLIHHLHGGDVVRVLGRPAATAAECGGVARRHERRHGPVLGRRLLVLILILVVVVVIAVLREPGAYTRPVFSSS